MPQVAPVSTAVARGETSLEESEVPGEVLCFPGHFLPRDWISGWRGDGQASFSFPLPGGLTCERGSPGEHIPACRATASLSEPLPAASCRENVQVDECVDFLLS